MRSLSFVLVGLLATSVGACSASVNGAFSTGGGGGSGGSDGGAAAGGTGGTGNTGNTGGDINIGATGGVGGSGGAGSTCNTGPDEDGDGDGFSKNQGDCNDCDANVNPGAIEVVITEPDDMGNVPTPADEDCDGTVDNPAPATCDDAIDLNDFDPMAAARAIDLCQVSTGTSWGVLSAAYVRADGVTPLAPSASFPVASVLADFGVVPVQKGARFLGLSSGYARDAGDPNNCGAFSCSTTGAGTPPAAPYCDMFPTCYPQDASGQGGANINDDAAFRVVIRSPKNATGYRFLFKFYSFEYPEWVGSSFNDQFVALVLPKPMGAHDGNVSFDSSGNAVSVNVAFFNGAQADLQGTGFDVWDDAGSTAWLQTSVPITGGDDIDVLFAIWDTSDDLWDSTVLIDGFEWIANGGTVVIGTEPPPPPN
jgi:hypothetical protein